MGPAQAERLLHHQPRMPNPAAFLDLDLRGNTLFQCFQMADDADHLAAGVERVECGEGDLQGITVQRAGIENITRDQHRVHRMRIDLDQQLVDQGLVLRLAALAHEVLAQMPVGGVEDAHGGVVR